MYRELMESERGVFQEVADTIAGMLEEFAQREERGREDDIIAARIAEILINRVEELYGEFNFYPGYPCDKCYNFALFLSLTSPKYQKVSSHIVGINRRRQHNPLLVGTTMTRVRSSLSLNRIMEKVVQHMQGYCKGKTAKVLVICDNWDPQDYEHWRGNLINISQEATIEIYFIQDGRAFRMKI